MWSLKLSQQQFSIAKHVFDFQELLHTTSTLIHRPLVVRAWDWTIQWMITIGIWVAITFVFTPDKWFSDCGYTGDYLKPVWSFVWLPSAVCGPQICLVVGSQELSLWVKTTCWRDEQSKYLRICLLKSFFCRPEGSLHFQRSPLLTNTPHMVSHKSYCMAYVSQQMALPVLVTHLYWSCSVVDFS